MYLCLKSYFKFGDNFYKQVDGAAVGSPLSPTVAHINMEVLEKKAFKQRYIAQVWS